MTNLLISSFLSYAVVKVRGLSPSTHFPHRLPASFEAQCRQAFRNVFAIVKAAGGTPADIVRQTVYLTDLNNFAVVNKVMSEIFSAPYPARSCVQISALPKGGLIEVEATVVLD